MEDLIGFFQSNGIDLKNPELSGKFLRFGPKKVQWFIGHEYFNYRGESVPIATAGDWRTGVKFTFKSNVKLSPADKKAIKIYEQEQAKIIDEERRKINEQARKEIAELIPDCSTSIIPPHPYLDKKHIRDCPNSGVLYDPDQNIRITMQDVYGTVWNMQKILHNGNKYFHTGGRIDGTFHLIGEAIEKEAFICEGFSTGATIHMATGKPVLCAMNAQNMPKLCAELARQHPDTTFTICADDDYKTEINGKPHNTGLLAAEKASEIIGGNIITPKFASSENRGTDFNDLHCIEGIDAVKKVFDKKPTVKKMRHYYHLGFDSKGHWFYITRANTIKRVGLSQSTGFYELAPKGYWETLYEGTNGRTRWEDARSDVIDASLASGIFDASRIRGAGVWMDKGRIVVNTGTELICDGESFALNEIESYYYYVQTKQNIGNLHKKPATVSDCSSLCEVAALLRWDHPTDAFLFIGWLAVARIAGALPVRPHIWVTGESGSGKSTVMNSIVEPCLGKPSGRIFLQGSSTEAGMRQTIGSNSIPIMFDEFETDGRYSSDRVLSILELLRQSWSQTGGKIYKGTAGGDSLEYSLNFAALVSSIVVNLPNQADRSRFSVLELSKNAGSDNWDMIQLLLGFIDEEFGEQLFARSILQARNIIKSYHLLQRKIATMNSQRLGQQAGMLLAGFHSLTSDDTITDSEADALLHRFDFDNEKADDISDQEELISYLMTKRIRLYVMNENARMERASEMTVEKAIQCATDYSSDEMYYREQLYQYGFIIKDEDIFIMGNNAELKKLLMGTRWENGWTRSLKRIPGAETNQVVRHPIKKKAVRATKIPLKEIIGE